MKCLERSASNAISERSYDTSFEKQNPINGKQGVNTNWIAGQNSDPLFDYNTTDHSPFSTISDHHIDTDYMMGTQIFGINKAPHSEKYKDPSNKDKKLKDLILEAKSLLASFRDIYIKEDGEGFSSMTERGGSYQNNTRNSNDNFQHDQERLRGHLINLINRIDESNSERKDRVNEYLKEETRAAVLNLILTIAKEIKDEDILKEIMFDLIRTIYSNIKVEGLTTIYRYEAILKRIQEIQKSIITQKGYLKDLIYLRDSTNKPNEEAIDGYEKAIKKLEGIEKHFQNTRRDKEIELKIIESKILNSTGYYEYIDSLAIRKCIGTEVEGLRNKKKILKSIPESSQQEMEIFAFDIIRNLDKIYVVLGPEKRGSFSSVYKCRDIENDRNVAIKISKLEEFRSITEKEIEMNKVLASQENKSENIIYLYEIFCIDNLLYMVFDFSKQDLFDFLVNDCKDYIMGDEIIDERLIDTEGNIRISNTYEDFYEVIYESLDNEIYSKQSNNMSEKNRIPKNMLIEKSETYLIKIRIMEQIFQVLEYLHENNIVHGDIKPENILIDSTDPLRIKICDFGLSFFADDKKGGLSGTLNYIAPETLNLSSSGTPVDIWACGCMMYTLLTRKMLFWENDLGKQKEILKDFSDSLRKYKKNEKYKCRELDLFIRNLSSYRDSFDFIIALLNENPNERPTASKALELLKEHFQFIS